MSWAFPGESLEMTHIEVIVNQLFEFLYVLTQIVICDQIPILRVFPDRHIDDVVHQQVLVMVSPLVPPLPRIQVGVVLTRLVIRVPPVAPLLHLVLLLLALSQQLGSYLLR